MEDLAHLTLMCLINVRFPGFFNPKIAIMGVQCGPDKMFGPMEQTPI